MEIYLVIFGISLALVAASLIGQSDEDRKPHLFLYILSGALLVMLLSLREGVGTDYYPIYVDGFNLAIEGKSSRFEFGYDLLQRCIALLTDDYHLLFFVCALITVGLTFLAIHRLSSDPVLSIIIFLFGGFFFFSTNAIRQCIAEAILLNALVYLFKKKPTPFIALTLLASSFHTAALCFMPLYYFTKRQVRPKTMVVTAALLFVAGSIVFNVLFQLASIISPQFARYVNLDQYFLGDFDIIDFVYFFLGLALWAYVAHKTRDKPSLGNESMRSLNIYASILFVGLLFTIVSLNAAIMFRMARLFTPVLILAIPAFLDRLRCDDERIPIKIFIISFFVASSLFIYGYMNFDTVVPYESFLF